MVRQEKLGGPEIDIQAVLPTLERRGLRRAEILTMPMDTFRLTMYSNHAPTKEKSNGYSPVKLMSLSLSNELFSFYAGDSDKLDKERLISVQNMLKGLFNASNPGQVESFKKVVDGFNDDPNQGGEAARAYHYVERDPDINPALLDFYKLNGYAIPTKYYDAARVHKKTLTREGVVEHHLVIPKSTAVSNLDSLTRLISDRQKGAQAAIDDVTKPRDYKEKPKTSSPYDMSDIVSSLFGTPGRERKGTDSPTRRSSERESTEVLRKGPFKSSRKLSGQRGMSPQVMKMAKTLVEQIEASKDPNSDYVRKGGSVDAGFTLSGPTGTGKTSLVEAIAGETGGFVAEFLPSSILSPWMHQSGIQLAEKLEETTSNFFRNHKRETLFIVINEADAFFPDRSNLKGTPSGDSKSEFVSTALPLIEKLRRENPSGRLILCFTTNLKLDPAMQRRIGPNIEVVRPDTNGRAEIFSKYLAECLVKGGPSVLPSDMREAINAYETAFAGVGSIDNRNELKPYISNLVKVLGPVLKVCQESNLAGGDIEEIVRRAYNRYLLDITNKKMENNGMTVDGYLVPMANSWKPDEEQKKPFGFGN